MAKPTTLTIAVLLLTAGCLSNSSAADYEAEYAGYYGANAAELGSDMLEPHDGVIENIAVVNTHLCAGQSVEIKVEPTDSSADVFIDGEAGVRHLIQLLGDPGPRDLDVFVDGSTGRALVPVKVELIPCETVMPAIEVRSHRQRERDIHVSVDLQRHDGPFQWEFSDGSRFSTDTPWIDHRFAPGDLDWTEGYATQQVLVVAGTGATALRTFNIELEYAHDRAHGLITAPIDYDPARPALGVVVHNMERDDIMRITSIETTLTPCDRNAMASRSELDQAFTVAYGQGARGFVDSREDASVCRMDIRFRGYMELSGFRVASVAHFVMGNTWTTAHLSTVDGEALNDRLELAPVRLPHVRLHPE